MDRYLPFPLFAFFEFNPHPLRPSNSRPGGIVHWICGWPLLHFPRDMVTVAGRMVHPSGSVRSPCLDPAMVWTNRKDFNTTKTKTRENIQHLNRKPSSLFINTEVFNLQRLYNPCNCNLFKMLTIRTKTTCFQSMPPHTVCLRCSPTGSDS